MTLLLWHCTKCDSGDDQMEAQWGRRKWWFFGERKRKLVAHRKECGSKMEFVGTF